MFLCSSVEFFNLWGLYDRYSNHENFGGLKCARKTVRRNLTQDSITSPAISCAWFVCSIGALDARPKVGQHFTCQTCTQASADYSLHCQRLHTKIRHSLVLEPVILAQNSIFLIVFPSEEWGSMLMGTLGSKRSIYLQLIVKFWDSRRFHSSSGYFCFHSFFFLLH